MRKLDINNRRYLGSKYKLLNFIEKTVNENCNDIKSVIDVFAGTGVVGDLFLKKGKEVYFNDYLKSNFYSYKAFYEPVKVDIKKIENIINKYNAMHIDGENYFSQNFSDTYFSSNDCRKIGYIRDDIDKKYKEGKINEREKSVLITSLIYSMDRVANTVGHYDAYRKIENIQDKFFMYMIDINKNGETKSHISNEDANEFIKEVKADLVYIDPPYNSRQYCDAYHFLENVALNKKPEVFGTARKMDRSNLKSKYCTAKAATEFADLIENIKAKYILVSYNNTGEKGNARSNAKISDSQIMEILGKKGEVKVFEQEYALFNTGKTKLDDHKERLFLCIVGQKKNEHIVNSISGLVKSPLNYTGGKYKILTLLMDKFPKDIDMFFDIFSGGGNVGVNIEANKIICVDINDRKCRCTIGERDISKDISRSSVVEF